MLLKLVDGGIENIKTDEEYLPGCPTCDYGSQYINDVEVTLTKHIIRASFNNLPNVDAIQKMTESEFIEWLRLAFTQKVDEAYQCEYATLDFEVSDKINGSEEI